MTSRLPPLTPTKASPLYPNDVSPNRTPGRSSAQRPGLAESERLSGSKYGQDSQIVDIQASMEARYAVETDGWKNRWQDAEARRSFLETENISLVREIEFWKSKGNVEDNDRAQRLVNADNTGADQIEQVKQLVDSQNEALRLEAERLRGLLAVKIEESNVIRVNCSKLEQINQETSSKKEVAQDYEIRIQRLKGDYTEKMREIEELMLQRNQLEQQSLEAQKAQRQAESLKDLLEAKREENERTRREKQAVQNELIKSKQVENALLEKETLLKTELQLLEQKAVSAEENRKALYSEKMKIYQAAQESAKKQFYDEQLSIEGDLEARQKIAASRAAETENLKRKYQDLSNDLAVAEEESNNAEAELSAWKSKAGIAENIREQDIQKAVKARDAYIQQTIDETLREKRLLEGQIGNLNSTVMERSASLNYVQKEATATELEKRALEAERVKLLAQVDALVRKQDDNERIFQSIVHQRDNLNSRSLERIRKEHDNEKRRVGNQIQALRNVIDQKREEAERNRREANQFCLKLVNCENQASQAQGEATYWRNQTDRVSREKDIQYNAERNLTTAQLSDLARVQSLERIQKQRENDGVRGVIQLKDREAGDLRRRAQMTGSEIARDRQQQERLAQEAEAQRLRALQIEKSKLLEMQTKEQIHQSNVDSYLRQANQQTNALRSEVGQLQTTLVRKDLDADHWRQNYNRLASPIRKY